MQTLYYELGVLSKAIHFKNLSAAAVHVGLSQPQLSRIIARLEDEFQVVLLDRAAKRKSSWTPVAIEIAEVFKRSATRLESELQSMSHNQVVAEIHIGTLEGLSEFAIKTCKICFEKVGLQKITLDIFDLNELESHFLAGNLDMIFSSKLPGRQKFRHLVEIGTQVLNKVQTNRKFGVYSTFEFGRAQKKDTDQYDHLFVSNSLALRSSWLNGVGGVGYLPSETRKGKSKEQSEPVFLIGSELLNPTLWKGISDAIDF